MSAVLSGSTICLTPKPSVAHIFMIHIHRLAMVSPQATNTLFFLSRKNNINEYINSKINFQIMINVFVVVGHRLLADDRERKKNTQIRTALIIIYKLIVWLGTEQPCVRCYCLPMWLHRVHCDPNNIGVANRE